MGSLVCSHSDFQPNLKYDSERLIVYFIKYSWFLVCQKILVLWDLLLTFRSQVLVTDRTTVLAAVFIGICGGGSGGEGGVALL